MNAVTSHGVAVVEQAASPLVTTTAIRETTEQEASILEADARLDQKRDRKNLTDTMMARLSTATVDEEAYERVFETENAVLHAPRPPALQSNATTMDSAQSWAHSLDAALSDLMKFAETLVPQAAAEQGYSSVEALPLTTQQELLISNLPAEALLAAFLKINIDDPNNSVETHNAMHELSTLLRQQSITEEKLVNLRQAELRREAEKSDSGWLNILLTIVAILLAATGVGTVLGAIVFALTVLSAILNAAGASEAAAIVGYITIAISLPSILKQVASKLTEIVSKLQSVTSSAAKTATPAAGQVSQVGQVGGEVTAAEPAAQTPEVKGAETGGATSLSPGGSLPATTSLSNPQSFLTDFATRIAEFTRESLKSFNSVLAAGDAALAGFWSKMGQGIKAGLGFGSAGVGNGVNAGAQTGANLGSAVPTAVSAPAVPTTISQPVQTSSTTMGQSSLSAPSKLLQRSAETVSKIAKGAFDAFMKAKDFLQTKMDMIAKKATDVLKTFKTNLGKLKQAVTSKLNIGDKLTALKDSMYGTGNPPGAVDAKLTKLATANDLATNSQGVAEATADSMKADVVRQTGLDKMNAQELKEFAANNEELFSAKDLEAMENMSESEIRDKIATKMLSEILGNKDALPSDQILEYIEKSYLAEMKQEMTTLMRAELGETVDVEKLADQVMDNMQGISASSGGEMIRRTMELLLGLAQAGQNANEAVKEHELAMAQVAIQKQELRLTAIEFMNGQHQETIEREAGIIEEIMRSKNEIVDAVLSMTAARFQSTQKLLAATMSRA